MDNTLGKRDTTTVLGFIRTWFQPRSTDRDEAFRERIIRIALALLLVGAALNLANAVFVFRDPWGFISFPATNLYALLVYISSAYAVIKKRLVLAGWLLTFGTLVLLIMSLLISLQENLALDPTSGAGFMIIPLISTLVLPRQYIPFFTLVTGLAFGFLQFLVPTGIPDTTPISLFVSILLVLGLEGTMLYLFRTEFDARLNAMTQSLDQERISKDEAEVAQQRAEQADRAKSQFLANMSHELRTPLNAIIGYDEAMLGGMVGEFTPKQHQLLGHIQYNSRRLLGLINDVLDLSKVESGSLQVFTGPLSPQEVITRTLESVKSLAEEKDIALEVIIAENVPELVLGDEKKLEQILINLVGNAIKFTNKGGVYVDVLALDDKYWQFKIRDTGLGIAEDSLDSIFRPFQQVDNSSTRKFKGTGLGLSITKRFIEVLNGEITVTSEVDKGTTFAVTLPRTTTTVQTHETQLKQAKSIAEHPIA